MIVLLFVVLFALMALGQYVFAAMGLSAVVVLLRQGIPLSIIPQHTVGGVDALALVAIPFYILVGEVMTVSGITTRLVNFSKLLVGHLRGGLAYVAVMADVFAAGVSGSAVADASATGAVLLPAMDKAGYRRDFAAAINASASTVGPVIPPSIPLIIIGLMTNLSIAQLFLGGLIPGLLMSALLIVILAVIMRRGDYPHGERVDRSPAAVIRTFRDAFFALLAPVIIVVGIVGGIVTIVEASILAAAYVLFVGVAIYRTIKLRELPGLFQRTAVFSSTLLVIFAAIGPFAWIMARGRVAPGIVAAIEALNLGRWQFILLVMILFLIMGMVMDGLIIILLFMPILLPVAVELGIDPIHFSVMIVVNLMVGLMTPPMGALLFVMQRLSGVPFHRLVRATLPFLVALLIALLLVGYVEALVVTLPRMVFGP